MKKHLLACVITTAGVFTAVASPVVAGFNTSTLANCDDCYSDAASLGFSASFFGTSYTQAYVSNNGYLTFGAGQSYYTPTGLSGYTGLPIIAGFYADADTRGAGTVTYGTGTYNGYAAFGVTWNGVGYFPSQTDKTNTFQELLVSRPDLGAGVFEIVFNYGQIQWETGAGNGGTDGLGGISAAIGYADGSGMAGTYVQLPGSLVNGALIDGGPNSLVAGSNNGTPGQYVFVLANGDVANTAPEPTATMLLGTGVLVFAAVRRAARRT